MRDETHLLSRRDFRLHAHRQFAAQEAEGALPVSLRLRHAVEGSGKAAELAAVRGEAGSGREIAVAPSISDQQEPIERTTDQLRAGQGRRGERQHGPGDDQDKPLEVCLRRRSERDLPVQSNPDAQSLRFGPDRRVRRDALPAVQPLQLDDPDLAAFQAEPVFRDHGVADKPCAIGVAGQDRAIAVLDRRNGIGRQGETLELLPQPVDAERNLDHPGDNPFPVSERLCHVDGRLIREPAYRVLPDDETSGLQGEAEEGPIGHVGAGVERA